jgi:hypothetical protein
MIKLLFIVSGSVTTITEAAAVDESALLSEDLLEKEVFDLIPSIDTETLGLIDQELATFDFIFSSSIENLIN